MSNISVKDIKEAKTALKTFSTKFEKVLGPVGQNYTAPIVKVLEIEEAKAVEAAKYADLSDEEIQEKKDSDRVKGLKELQDAANAKLAKKMGPKKVEVAVVDVEPDGGLLEVA